MALTRDFKKTVIDRAEREPEFAKSLLNEATILFLNGEPETARLILFDLLNPTTDLEPCRPDSGFIVTRHSHS